jgi:hypothetical protein
MTWGCKTPQVTNPSVVIKLWKRSLPTLCCGSPQPGAAIFSRDAAQLVDAYCPEFLQECLTRGITCFRVDEVCIKKLKDTYANILLYGGGAFLENFWPHVKFKYVHYMDAPENTPITATLKFSELRSKRITQTTDQNVEFFYEEV